jgi:hypothetical protein
MKKLLLLIWTLLMFQNIFTQNAYYDALFINTLSEDALNNILLAHSDKMIYLTIDEINQIKSTNIFLKNPFENSLTHFNIKPVKSAISKYNALVQIELNSHQGYVSKFVDPATSSLILGLIPGALSGQFSLSAADQTKIIDGLTKYYAEEFRKAQLLTYTQTFKSTIGEVGEFQILFPNTYEKLKNTNPSKFPELGAEYKEIFSQDLKALLDNLINHIEKHKTTHELESKLHFLNFENTSKIQNIPYYKSLKLSADIGSKLSNNFHPVDLFQYLDATYYEKSYLDSITNLEQQLSIIIHGINLLQFNVLDTAKSKSNNFENVWLSFEEFNKINTISEWNYFAGLIFQQDKEFFRKIFLTPTSENLTNEQIEKIKKKYTKLLSGLQLIQGFRNSLNDENLTTNFLEYMKIVSNLFEVANFYDYDVSKYIKVSNYTLHMYDNGRSKNYSNSIHYLTLILNEFLGTNPTYLETLQKIDQYGTFMTDVINAENSDEVKEVIKKHAAPPASFILKREFAHTLSITGQPGYFISGEYLENNIGFVSGITLPMGFEFSFKLKKGQDNGPSLGIFAQIIDLGAILNFRVSDSTSTLPDKIVFNQIFSPGGSLTYGFKNSPVTLGLGYQCTPELRSVTLENGNQIFPSGHRVFFRLAWDIPLINVYKCKKKFTASP